MKTLGKVKRTGRGFQWIEFADRNGVPCSLQASSLADYTTPGISAIWLGCEDPNPKVLHYEAVALGVQTDETSGWVPFPLPPQVQCTTRAHLDREQVAALIAHLTAWLTHGTFELPTKKKRGAK